MFVVVYHDDYNNEVKCLGAFNKKENAIKKLNKVLEETIVKYKGYIVES